MQCFVPWAVGKISTDNHDHTDVYQKEWKFTYHYSKQYDGLIILLNPMRSQREPMILCGHIFYILYFKEDNLF